MHGEHARVEIGYMTSTNISHGLPIAILKDCLLPAMSLAFAATWVPLLWSEPPEDPLPLPVGSGTADRGPSEVRSLSDALLWWPASFIGSEPLDEPPEKQFYLVYLLHWNYFDKVLPNVKNSHMQS